MTKSTKERMIQRERRIQELMARGLDRNTILDTVAKENSVGVKAIERQYYQIVKSIQRLVKEDRHELRANLLARQDAIYQACFDKESYKLALEATNVMAKLGGLYESEIEEIKRPEAIIFKERDFSQPLQVVPKKAE